LKHLCFHADFPDKILVFVRMGLRRFKAIAKPFQAVEPRAQIRRIEFSHLPFLPDGS
jgi:hypothetical protein